MRPVQKVSVSLLIAIIGFSAFSFFAFSGLFDAIEASFYSPRVLEHYRSELTNAHRELVEFRENNLARFSAVVEQAEIRTLYQPNQTRGDIEARAGIFRRIADDRSGFVASVFLNRDGTQLHFSTREDDYTESAGIRSYRPLEEIEDGERLSELALAVPDEADMVLDAETSSLIFRHPVIDVNGIWRGTGLFIFSSRSFTNRLISAGITDPDRVIELVSPNGILLNVRREGRAELREGVADSWEQSDEESLIRLSGDRDIVVPVLERSDFRIGYVVPADELMLSNELQAIVLAGTFLTLFLIVFLLLNIRQDSTVVLSERIKRFQLGLLREYLERGEELDWRSRRDELLRRKPEMTRRLKQGIGRVRAEDREKIDDLVDKSWDEIIDVLGSRSDSGRSESDLQQIERMLERVIGNLESRGINPQSPRTGTSDTPGLEESPRKQERAERDRSTSDHASEAAGRPEPAAELDAASDVEEVEELDELDDATDTEEVEELDELDAASDTEEVQELDELDAASDAEEVEELDELDAASDAEEVEELDELDAASDAEEVEELDELDAATDTGEVEELEATSNAEEHSELESVEDEDSAQAFDSDTVDRAKPVEAPDDLDDAEAIGILEEVEAAEWVDGGESIAEEDTPDGPEELEEVEPLDSVDTSAEGLGDESDELRNADIRDEVAAIADGSGPARSSSTAGGATLEGREITDAWQSHAGESGSANEAGGTVERSDMAQFETANRKRDAQSVASDSAFSENGEIVSLENARVAADEQSIVSDPGGVYRIREDLYSRSAERRESPREASSDGETARRAGSARSDDAVLLLGDVDMRPLTRRTIPPGRESSGRSDDVRAQPAEAEGSDSTPAFAAEGLDFDRYLSRFRDDEPGIMRALMLLTRKVYARVAMIAVQGDNAYRSEYGIGLNEHEKESLHISERSQFARSILNEGRLYRFEGSVTELTDVHVTGEDTSIGNCRCVVFVPIKFRGRRAYLVLGMRDSVGELQDIVVALADTIRSRPSHR